MNTQYEMVPNIISTKDMDYLADMFEWNLGDYKKIKNSIEQVQDENIKQLLETVSNVFLKNTEQILNILKGECCEQ